MLTPLTSLIVCLILVSWHAERVVEQESQQASAPTIAGKVSARRGQGQIVHVTLEGTAGSVIPAISDRVVFSRKVSGFDARAGEGRVTEVGDGYVVVDVTSGQPDFETTAVIYATGKREPPRALPKISTSPETRPGGLTGPRLDATTREARAKSLLGTTLAAMGGRDRLGQVGMVVLADDVEEVGSEGVTRAQRSFVRRFRPGAFRVVLSFQDNRRRILAALEEEGLAYEVDGAKVGNLPENQLFRHRCASPQAAWLTLLNWANEGGAVDLLEPASDDSERVEIRTGGLTTIVLNIDKATHRVVRSEFTQPGEGGATTVTACVFREYRTVQGIQTPYLTQVESDGKLVMSARVRSVEFLQEADARHLKPDVYEAGALASNFVRRGSDWWDLAGRFYKVACELGRASACDSFSYYSNWKDRSEVAKRVTPLDLSTLNAFVGIKRGDNQKRVRERLGPPQGDGHYYDGPPENYQNRVLYISYSESGRVVTIRVISPRALEWLARRGIQDPVASLVGQHRSVLLGTFGRPARESGGWTTWEGRGRHSPFLTATCYDFEFDACREINVQFFY